MALWALVALGVLLMALESDAPAPAESPTRTPLPTLAIAQVASPPPSASPTALSAPAVTLPPPSATPTRTPSPVTQPATAAPAADTPPDPAACTPPDGWERYTVQQGDTLFAFMLGAGSTVTVDELMAANCLDRRWLKVDEVLYLPPGAAENAPPSDPYVPPSGPDGMGPVGPRTPNCPCTITVPVGWRLEQVADAINRSETAFTGADFLAVTGPGASAPFDFVMARPAGASMEGFMFPGTYTVQNDTTAEGFRDMMLSNFAANVTPQMRADAAAQGVSFYEALIIASIVQREVRGPETQKIVASVYYNRYRDGNRLGTTVSVQYALGQPGAWWPRVTGTGLKVDSPYNTYNRAGLPPTPIDSPGLSAIVAALYPAQTTYRFHTASCDGSGEAFAETYEQHLANVNCE